ncbi:trans-sulfuration enzyme family protein [Anaerobacillus isosaccharinicus]|uniref:homocysteine desulfhydrase n=1 Tax=Anaerobacillus isosaccharinicus TaxID=1532552 RepID=A0A1S2MED6_9BACI|nr:aminotransferase class I/II-fold pyridoxal phosphate-dependent enzyme [Anaerobacillus isosaccharinicus]MBA5588804.1 aminotransferase class I/II-fold pyridoxal phosphate-dependent enzyme [Anaerobacillus isosaccharinicus]QOY37802.1 aminotransferase class I/II-fold pyridoxal phosphate-dependent enzyme [Anaerobacillus isosaccharinicus]
MTFKFNTKTVHFQKKAEEKNVSKSQPIYQTSAFSFKDLDDMEDFYRGNKEYLYTRFSNPNTDDLGQGVAQLEGAPKGVATSSGMSAILAGVLAVVSHGDHIIASEDIYGGTYQLFATELKEFGIEVSFVSMNNFAEIENSIKVNTKLLYSESITNPLLRVEDLPSLISLAKKHNIITMIDNTFATPFLIKPYELGADLVIHSATKYIGGHSDVTAGVLVGNEVLITKAKTKVVNLGCNLSPFEAWLACRGLKTLAVRMDRQVKNAQALADFFRSNLSIAKVYYPDSVSENGNGANVSIDLGENYNVETFFKSLQWIRIVPTLAGVESTVTYPLRTSHRSVPDAIRSKLGITKGLVRISLGIEDDEDIIKAFEEALNKAKL